MHHKSKSIHIHVLMNGHNPEHRHEKKSHPEKHFNSSNAKPSDILMRGHHFHGGIASVPQTFSKGGKAHRGRRYAEGGHVDPSIEPHLNMPRIGANGMRRMAPQPQRMFSKGGHCYADGGEAKEYGEKPLTGQLRKGGRATHRRHHFAGESVENDYMDHNPREGMPQAEQLRKGGRARHRQHHEEGETVRDEKSHGGRAKHRQHHYWGQSVIGRLPLVGGIANSIANTAGTLDPHKYGGSEYVANTKGRKALDIFSTIGNLGASAALGKKSHGGGVHHKHRQHHAEGGVGKVRKGMMTKSGRMIHSED